jgi:hypothetical protein
MAVRRVIAAASMLAALTTWSARAQPHQQGTGATLGTVVFPNSGAPAAQGGLSASAII